MRYLIFPHIRPDPDTLGSSFALWRGLQKAGHEASIYRTGPVPENLRGLFPAQDEAFVEDPDPADYDEAFLVDANGRHRTEGPIEAFHGRLHVIDHHPDEQEDGRLSARIDTSASASAELIWAYLQQELAVEIDREMATYLYIALVADTGRFAFQSVTPRTFQVAADLRQRGVAVDEVTQAFSRRSAAELNGQALVINRMRELEPAGAPCAFVSTLDLEDLKAHDTATDAAALAVNTIGQLEGVDVYFLLVEEAVDDRVRTRIRLRSNDDQYPVNELAVSLGGGGHHMAAGAVLDCRLQEAVAKLEAVFREHYR